MSATGEPPTRRSRTARRFGVSTMREVFRLGERLVPVEQAAAENRALRADLERVVAELDERVAAYARSRSGD